MYKVEYLILVEGINCTTVKALKNLIQSDVDFSVSGEKIQFKKFEFKLNVKKGRVETNNQTFFHLTLSINEEKKIPQFNIALKQLKRVLSIINKSQITLWNDVSKLYSSKAYAKIFDIENQMRKLLSKFMFINIGMGWATDRIPNDVKKSVQSDKKDVNFLQNVDFIQLSNFLFSESYPSHKEGLVNKLRQAKDLASLNIDEVRSLLPESNWDKYFEQIVECDAEYLKKRWEKLYLLRCKVAHNNFFSKSDLDDVEKLTSEIGGYIEKAIKNLDDVVVPEEEIESIAENVAVGRNESLGRYIMNWRAFEFNAQLLVKQLSEEKVPRFLSMNLIFKILVEKNIFKPSDLTELRNIFQFRNNIVHGLDKDISNIEVNNEIEKIVAYTEIIKDNLVNTEESHLEKIGNPEIIEIYQELKNRILKLEDVNLKPNKHYISFVGKSNIVDIQLQQKSLKIWINLFKGDLKDPYNIAKDVSRVGHLGNGDYEIKLSSNNDIEKIMEFIIQSYSKNLK